MPKAEELRKLRMKTIMNNEHNFNTWKQFESHIWKFLALEGMTSDKIEMDYLKCIKKFSTLAKNA